MDKSKTVSVRLSNEEFETIEKFREKYQMKSPNDFFRGASAFFISMIEALVNMANSEELNSKVENFNKTVKNELEKVPDTQAKLKGKYDILENKILPEYEKYIDKAIDSIKPFAQERSAGRPSNPKAGPGRPKDTGY